MMQKYGIFDKDGRLDCDPEPMVFDSRKEAIEMLNSDAYDGADGYTVCMVIGGPAECMKFKGDVVKYANSHYVRLPKYLMDAHGIREGDKVAVTIEKVQEQKIEE